MDEYGRRPLHYAVLAGDLTLVEKLLADSAPAFQ